MTADVISTLRHTIRDRIEDCWRAALPALDAHREEEALPLLQHAAERRPNDARLWQMVALCARNLSELAPAISAFDRALELAPRAPSIVHGSARARLEAGLSAIDAYQRALTLSPQDGSVIQGLAAARWAEGDLAGAVAGLAPIVRDNPLWLDGHATLSRLRRMIGEPDDLQSYRQAVTLQPAAINLWQAWLSTLSTAERFAEIPRVTDAARRAVGAHRGFDLADAVSDDERGHHSRAGLFFDSLPDQVEPAIRVRQIRSLIRRGRITEAEAKAARDVTLHGGGALWPYLTLMWRALDDTRWIRMVGEPSFIQTYDLTRDVNDWDALTARLRSLHVAHDEPLDQSVRRGTQTDGPLLSRTDPDITELRRAITAAVARYIDQLPPAVANHPLLSARRRPIRFAGSWSVRLTGGGHHVDHVHSHGWISSALYVSLPEDMGGTERAGWLKLGSADALLPDMPAFHEVQPRPGTLVLFPSTLWHGTRPFSTGERLTVAFDVARIQ